MTEEAAGREKQRLGAAGSGIAKRGRAARDVIRNITRRKQADEVSWATAETARALLNASTEAALLADVSGTILALNETAAQRMGKQVDEVVGRTVFDLFARNVAERKRAAGNEVIRSGKPYRYQDEQEGRWFDTTVYPILDAEGKIGRFAIFAADITERKRAEEELRESEERYRSLFEGAFEGIGIHEQGVILDANPAFARMFGYSLSEMKGMSVLNLVAEKHHDLVVRNIASGADAAYEVDVVRKDGTTFCVEAVAREHTYKGRSVRVVTTRDITERKRAEEELRESEERLRGLFEAAFEGIIVHEKGVILDANPAFEKMFGYRLSELVGKSVLDLAAEESRDLIMKKLRSEAGEPYEAVGLRKDGTTFTGELISKEHTYKGRRVRVTTIGDITERKRAEEALRESEERYRAVFDQAADSIVLIDADTGALVEFNDRAHEILGYSREEFEKLRIPDFEAIESAEEVAKHIEKAIREGSATFETKHRTKDGKILDIEVRCRAVSIGGRDFLETIFHDITERKRAEEALRESEERYRNLVENINDAVYEADASGRITYIGPVIEEVGGFSPSEIIGRPFTELVHPDDLPLVVESFRERLAGKTIPIDYRVLDKTGEAHWVRSFGRPILEGDRAVGVRGVLTDVTERKRAEEALRESEEKYRTLVENANDYIIILQHGRTVYQNPSYAKFLGYSVSETVGRSYLDFIAEEDRDRVNSHYEKRLCGEAAPSQYEVRVLTKDGRRATMEVKPSVIQYKGEPAIMVVLHDISERKRAEEALIREKDIAQRYLDVAEVILMAIDHEGTVTLINQKGCRILGYEEDKIVGQNWFDAFLPATGREGIRDTFHRSMAGEMEPVEYHENPIRTKSGEERIIAWRNTVVRDETGNITGTLSSGEDITERKKMGEALQAAREELEARVERQMLRRNPYHLTFRELTVLHLVAIGRSDKEIGAELSISPLTAQKHISNILGKMGATSRTEAGVRAIREGLLD